MKLNRAIIQIVQNAIHHDSAPVLGVVNKLKPRYKTDREACNARDAILSVVSSSVLVRAQELKDGGYVVTVNGFWLDEK